MDTAPYGQMTGVRKLLAELLWEQSEDIALHDEEAMIMEGASSDTASDEEAPGLQMHPVPELMSVKSNYGLAAAQQRRRYFAWFATAVVSAAVLALVALAPRMREVSRGASLSTQASSNHQDLARKYVLVEAQVEPWPSLAGHAQQSEPWPVSCVYGETPECPGNALFFNPEVLMTAAENLMRIGQGEVLAESDKDLVVDVVTKGFASISRQLKERAPEVAQKLAAKPVNEAQRDMVLHAMRLLSDRRVQLLGADVVRAVRRSDVAEKQAVLLDVMAMLHSRLKELQGLAHELLPDAPSAFWASEQELARAFDSESIRAIRGGQGPGVASSAALPSAVASSPAELSREQKASAISRGAAEEGRELVRILQLSTGLLGPKLRLPTNALGFSEAVDLSACSTAHEDGHISKPTSVAAFLCPLRLGALGIDALHVIAAVGAAAKA